jgi:hypothetical protein
MAYKGGAGDGCNVRPAPDQELHGAKQMATPRISGFRNPCTRFAGSAIRAVIAFYVVLYALGALIALLSAWTG